MTKHTEARPLSGKRILIVEDRFLLADDMRRLFDRAGAEVIGPIAKVEQASELASSGKLDCAMLDIDLRGRLAFGVAEILDLHGVPFLFTTGFDQASLPERWMDRPFLSKPISPRRLLNIAAALANGQALVD